MRLAFSTRNVRLNSFLELCNYARDYGFDGFEVDFDEAMKRSTMYKEFETHQREASCNLLNQEVK